MTSTGKVFAYIIQSVCWTKGWGTTGTTRMFPSINNGEELQWLVDNGYLFHYEIETYDKHRNWRYKYSTADIYGLTRKGWAIAEKYVKAAEAEDPEYKIGYQYEHYPRRPVVA